MTDLTLRGAKGSELTWDELDSNFTALRATADKAAAGKFQDGTAAAPGISFEADGDTGLRRVSANAVALVTGGNDRVVFYEGSTEFRGYVKTITANGGAIQGFRDATPSWFVGDLKEATGSGSGMVSWVYGNNPYAVYINGGERFKVDLGGATITGSASATRFLNGAPMGVSEANARNHFKQYNAGTATITNGWVAAAFGDETGNRVVVGQAGGVAIVGGHSGSLSAWSALVFGGEQFSWTSNGLGSGNLMTLDSSANLSVKGSLQIGNQQFLGSGSFGRFWGGATLAIGQAQYAGLYGPVTSYNAKIVGGAWKSIGGGTATAVTIDEGIFSVAESQSAAGPDTNLTWTTSAQITKARASFRGYLDVDGGGIDWAPSGIQGAVIGRVGNDVYLSTHYDVSSLTLGAGVTTKTGITIYGQHHASGNMILLKVGNFVPFELKPSQLRLFNRLVASGSTGNQYLQSAIETNGGGSNATKPSLGFHQPGFFAGTLRMDDSTQFGFYQIDSTSLADLVVRNLNSAQLKGGRVTLPVIVKDTNDTNYGNDIYIPYDGGGSTQRSFRLRSSYNGGYGQLRLEVSSDSGAQYTDPAALTYGGIVTFNADGTVQVNSSAGAKGLVVSALGLTASQVNIGIGYLTTGRPFVGTNTSSNPLEVGTRASVPLLFVTNGVERMRLLESGDLLVGQATSGGSGGVNADASQIGKGTLTISHVTGTAGGAAYAYFGIGGTGIGSITQSGSTAVSYNTTSDWRLKTNVRPSDAKRFMEIQFVDFEWTDGRHDCGVIAHQLQAIYPDLVTGKKDAVEMRTVEVKPAVTELRLVSEAVDAVMDGDQVITPAQDAVYEPVEVSPAVTELQEFPVYQQVNYQGLIPRMGTVIQQQQLVIEGLFAQIEALTKRITNLEGKKNV